MKYGGRYSKSATPNDMTIQIMLADLTPEKQKEILDAMHISVPEEGNLDEVPVATLETE